MQHRLEAGGMLEEGVDRGDELELCRLPRAAAAVASGLRDDR